MPHHHPARLRQQRQSAHPIFRSTARDHATVALIVAGVLAIGYFTAIGFAASMIAWGWVAV